MKTNCPTCGGKGFYPVADGPDDFQMIECKCADVVEISQLSGLSETAHYFIHEMQNELMGKFWDINNPVGF